MWFSLLLLSDPDGWPKFYLFNPSKFLFHYLKSFPIMALKFSKVVSGHNWSSTYANLGTEHNYWIFLESAVRTPNPFIGWVMIFSNIHLLIFKPLFVLDIQSFYRNLKAFWKSFFSLFEYIETLRIYVFCFSIYMF